MYEYSYFRIHTLNLTTYTVRIHVSLHNCTSVLYSYSHSTSLRDDLRNYCTRQNGRLNSLRFHFPELQMAVCLRNPQALSYDFWLSETDLWISQKALVLLIIHNCNLLCTICTVLYRYSYLYSTCTCTVHIT